MSITDFALLVIVAIASVCAGLAYNMTAREKPHLRAARRLLWGAGIGFWSLGVIWAATNHHYPLALRIFIAVLIGAVSVGGLAWLLSDMHQAFAAPPPAPPHEQHRQNATNPPHSDVGCPPGTAICAEGGSDNEIDHNKCVGAPQCVVEKNERHDKIHDNTSTPHP